MKIHKGQILEITHDRRGFFIGKAVKTFDTEKVEFYPIVVAQKTPVKGMSEEWAEGEYIPCRSSLTRIALQK